jgi:hypothetical protein
MEFVKYQHIERLGTDEVEGIENGRCHMFYKIDGTNSQAYLGEDGTLRAGSRNRELTPDNDNAGFCKYAMQEIRLQEYLKKHPTHRLFGEWLVPHSLKTYRDDAWKTYYIFDVCEENGEETRYLPYEEYKILLEEFGIDYIPPIATIENPTIEDLTNLLEKTGNFLIKDGAGNGEGIVIKNYNYKNKYGRQTWAKIVCNEFKEKHSKEMGVPTLIGSKKVESNIVDKFCTTQFIDKEYAKIVEEQNGWTSKYIPMLLGKVWHEFIVEESWNFIKEFKNPIIDYKTLNTMIMLKIKQVKQDLF